MVSRAVYGYPPDSDVYTPKPKLSIPEYTVDTEVKIGIDIVLPLNNEFTLLWFKDDDFVCDLMLFGRKIFKVLKEGMR